MKRTVQNVNFKENHVKRIVIVGSPGAGKSTFAKALAKKTGLPLFHLDLIWHKPDKTNISREEFDSALNRIVSGESWIIDGNYQRTLEIRFQCCDTVFLLDFPTDVCLSGITSRIGKPRDDLPWMETELDAEFKEFVLSFGEKNLPEIYRLIEKYREFKNIHVFRSRKEADSYLSSL